MQLPCVGSWVTKDVWRWHGCTGSSQKSGRYNAIREGCPMDNAVPGCGRCSRGPEVLLRRVDLQMWGSGVGCFANVATFPPHCYTSSDHAARSVEIPAARGTQAPPSFNLPHVTWMNSFRRLFRGMRWSESDVRWDMHKWLWARACIFYLLIHCRWWTKV